MPTKTIISICIRTLAGFIIIGLMLFVPAGRLGYPGAWLLMGLLFIPMIIIGAALLIKAPELLIKRVNMKETEAVQRRIILWSGLMFAGGFIVAGLDFRFGWSHVHDWVTTAAAAAFLAGYAMYAEVLRENAFLSRAVELQPGQRLVDTGLYGMVRHPMYLATVMMFLSMPLILGSYWALGIFLIYPVLIVKRIKNEEALLTEGLSGYPEYCKRVRYRLMPFIW